MIALNVWGDCMRGLNDGVSIMLTPARAIGAMLLGMRTLVALLALAGCGGSAQIARDSSVPDRATGDSAAISCESLDGGADADPRYLDLDIAASGFAAHEGQKVFLVTRGGIGTVLGVGTKTVAAGSFSFHFPKGYLRAWSQEILWLVDSDGDGLCTAAAGDHTGYVVAGGFDPAGNAPFAVSITDNHVGATPREPDLCNPTLAFGEMLDFNITGSGFAAHDGRTVRLLTRTGQNGAIFGAGQAMVTAGGFAFHFPKGFETFTYQEVIWFVDDDGDGTCTAADHTGSVVTSAFSPLQIEPLDMSITDNHMTMTARGADICTVMNGCQLAP